ncbi:hypothetical protein P7H71_13325 [Lactococcus lactis]|uniref:hypothetical protein n=1 Tax=Lactococcus lactis TaxID=1358 RepID=UPI00288FED2B|nr:hypothetical protein [Lactococcus lactis]MDT2879775.1 hypothetical protein [Lactococcus lactis]MDT2901481.1 hypothetical protein [Lactococcus lactis]MDT2968985.1 hypothetical protein [Lactococcus lactis]
MKKMNEQEIMTEVEDYGRQIFEAISYANEFPVVKEKLLIMFDKLIEELSELIDEDELNDDKKAKKSFIIFRRARKNDSDLYAKTIERNGSFFKRFKPTH